LPVAEAGVVTVAVEVELAVTGALSLVKIAVAGL
jgi:hypothetical protein